MAALIAGAAALSACGFRLGYDDQPSCVGAGCEARVDAAPEPPSGSTPDARGSGAGPGCSSTRLLHETFDGGATTYPWSATWQGAARAGLASDRVELSLGAGSAAARASYHTPSSWNLRGSELGARVLRTGGRETAIEVRAGALELPVGPLGSGVALAVRDGALVALAVDDDASTQLATAAYDPDRDVFWRIREDGGDLHWETSPDRAAWSSLHVAPAPMDTAAVWVNLVTRGPLATASQAWFDDVNPPADGAAGFCATGSIGDDFDDGTLGPLWKRWRGAGTSCTVAEVDGAVELRFPGTETSYCGLFHTQLLDLRDSQVSVELTDVPSAPGVVTVVDVMTAPTVRRAEIRITEGNAAMRVVRKPSPAESEVVLFTQSLAHDLVAHRFWQLRERAGRLTWATSPDGATWTDRAETATQLDVSAVTLGIAAWLFTASAQPPVVRFDRVNR